MAAREIAVEARARRAGRVADAGPRKVAQELRSRTKESGELGDALALHLGAPGKLARARLALAAGSALGVRREAALELAVACELLHNASLVHDDLQDRDDMRRGQPAVWAAFGDDVAINVGDYLLTKAMQTAASLPAHETARRRVVDAFATTTLTLLRGQTADNAARRSVSLSRADYEAIARAKTGALVVLPVEGALLLADADARTLERARAGLADLGAAYQVQDDLADVLGLKDGREPAADLSAGRPNAVTLHFLETCSEWERARLRAFLAEGGSAEECAHWADAVRGSAAVASAVADAMRLAGRGREALASLPEPLARVLDRAAARMNAPLEAIERLIGESGIEDAVGAVHADPAPALAEARA